MCSVSFLPGLSGGGYLLGVNRDERPARAAALPPAVLRPGGRSVLAPRDGKAGGTWIGVDTGGGALCLLNGDDPVASPPPPDARSRGLLVLELLADPQLDSVRAELDARVARGALRAAPFKLLVIAPGVGAAAHATWQCAEWDGAELRWSRGEDARLFVSSGFRPAEVAAVRRAAFAEFLAAPGRAAQLARPAEAGGGAEDSQHATVAEELRRFHAGHRDEAPDGDAWSVCLHREDARTVSFTLVSVDAARVSLSYRAGWPCRPGEESELSLPRSAIE